MTVYVVTSVDDSRWLSIEGVFSTQEKADEHAATIDPDDPHRCVDVDEMVVDAARDDTVEIVTLTEVCK